MMSNSSTLVTPAYIRTNTCKCAGNMKSCLCELWQEVTLGLALAHHLHCPLRAARHAQNASDALLGVQGHHPGQFLQSLKQRMVSCAAFCL
eukprot:1161807-Pelagomonas_calceolata.AAC.7